MRKKNVIKIQSGISMLLWVLATGSTIAQAAEMIPGARIDSLLELAQQNNPEISRMRDEAAAAKERIEPAGALPDPKFRLELRDITRMGEQNPTLSPSQVGSTKYLLMQDIPWYGKRELKREIAEQDSLNAKGKVDETWNNIAAKIKTYYAQLYYLERNKQLTKEIVNLLVRLEKIAQSRYAGGLVAQQDVIRAQIEQTQMRNELINQETEKHHVSIQLNVMLNRPANALLAEPEQLRPLPDPERLDISQLEEKIKKNNPALLIAETGIIGAQKKYNLASKSRYPDFTVGISPIQYQNAIEEWELMIEFNIPLQQETGRAQEREALAMVSSAHAQRAATINQLIADLTENIAAMDAARRTAALTKDHLLPQAEMTFKAALAGYETGQVNFATLLDAQRQIRQARQNLIKAETDGQIRLAEIERTVGENL